MLSRDRVFLRDYVQFSFLNHILVARALRASAGGGEATAIDVLSVVEDIDVAAATELVQQFNYVPRIKKIIVARLYAELAASLEDLGALCDAVRHRSNGGIFKRYARGLTPVACDAFDYILDNPTADLDALVNLPPLTALQKALPAAEYANFVTDYTELAQHLGDAARTYRTVPQTFQPQPVPSVLNAGWKDDMNIILDVFDVSETGTLAKGGVMAQVYNKLKHRFMVIEDLEALVQVTDTPGEMTAAYHPVTAAAFDNLGQAIRDVTMIGAELAALVLSLDTHGIPV